MKNYYFVVFIVLYFYNHLCCKAQNSLFDYKYNKDSAGYTKMEQIQKDIFNYEEELVQKTINYYKSGDWQTAIFYASNISNTTYSHFINIKFYCIIASNIKLSNKSKIYEAYKEGKSIIDSRTKALIDKELEEAAISIAILERQEYKEELTRKINEKKSIDKNFIIPSSIKIPLVIKEKIRIKKKMVKDNYIYLPINETIIYNGKEIIESGAEMKAKINYYKNSRTFGRPGSINFEIVSVSMANGQTLYLESEKVELKGKNNTALVLVVSILPAILVPYSLLCLLITGGDPILEQNMYINSYTKNKTLYRME